MPRKLVTEEEKMIWKERYLNGETARSIARDFPQYNENTISKNLRKMGISRGNRSFKILNLDKEAIKNDYLSKQYYCEELAKKYNIEVHNIYRILDEFNIERRTGKRSNCNEEYFDNIDTPHKAYILGFITADGSITGKYFSTLAIEIHEKDKELLNFIASEINPQATISPVIGEKKNNYKVSFSSAYMCNSLQKYGIIPNKSKNMQPVPYDLIPKELLKFYFRGLVDGDGSISQDGYISIYSGTKTFIENIQQILTKEIGVSVLGIYHGTSYFTTWSSEKDRKLLYDYLYGEDLEKTYYYKRKLNRLKNSLNLQANSEVST